jgi:hypothetical protein
MVMPGVVFLIVRVISILNSNYFDFRESFVDAGRAASSHTVMGPITNTTKSLVIMLVHLSFPKSLFEKNNLLHNKLIRISPVQSTIV